MNFHFSDMSRSSSVLSFHPVDLVKNFKPEKSQLVFNADFECGNLGDVTKISENEYELKIREDTNNSKFRLWYYFSGMLVIKHLFVNFWSNFFRSRDFTGTKN